jgi:hypothetical protein
VAELQKATAEVKDAEIKTALNGAVSVIILIFVPEATLYKVLAIGAHIYIDCKWGEGTVKGKVVFVAGEGQEVVEGLSEPFKKAVENLGKVGKRSFGIAGALLTAALDGKEVVEGFVKVKRLLEEIKSVEKAFDDLMAGLVPRVAEFIAQEKAVQQLDDAIAEAMARADNAATNYDAIKQEIQKATNKGN